MEDYLIYIAMDLCQDKVKPKTFLPQVVGRWLTLDKYWLITFVLSIMG
jgi:hypothetical protein